MDISWPAPPRSLTTDSTPSSAWASAAGSSSRRSEIYGGLRAAWDYGPLGVELKNNVKRQWWKSMVQQRDDIVGLDSSVILAREVWETCGHVDRVRRPADRVPVVPQALPRRPSRGGVRREARAAAGARLADINCPNCGTKGAFTEPKMFNGLLKTYLGPVEDESGLAYLRPETAQGIFINYSNVQQSSRKKPPFGIAQTGQVLPQRDHAGQLHLPHPRVRADGDGVLRQARHRRGMAPVLDRRAAGLVRRAGSCVRTTCASSSTRRRSCRTTRSARSTSSTGSASPGSSGASSKASRTAPTST